MREFKFIRGKYTNENIFNTDETSNCLFAYDSKGDLVQFIEKNDKDFQEKFVGLSSVNRISEIYTFRPSQFKISAQKESAGHYSFNFKADEDVYDGSRQFPTNVIEQAETRIKAQTEAEYKTTSGLPLLNLDDTTRRETLTAFKFNNDKTFTRDLIFKVTGTVKERGYATAKGESITAYPMSDGIIDFDDKTDTNAKSGTFYQGILQTAAPTKMGTIYRDPATVSAKGSLTLAKNYVASDGYRFIKDGSFETDIPYQDGLSFELYEGVSGYLTEADADKAVTITKTFNSSAEKYILNSSKEYELCSSADAGDNVTYYLIQYGSSASAPKLRKSSSEPEKYSEISGTDYYFVNDEVSKSFEALNFNSVANYLPTTTKVPTTSLQEERSVGNNKVAFIKANGNWQAVSSTDKITAKLFTTVLTDDVSKKENLSKIAIDEDGTYQLYYGVQEFITVTSENYLSAIGIDYYYNETLLDDYREFTATTAENRTKFIKLSSLDEIINNSAVDGSDFGYIYTPSVAVVNTKYALKSIKYVAYATTEELTELIDESQHQAYKRNEGKEVTSISSTSYNFYYVNSGTAYMSKGNCSVPTRNANQFVEGYAASYEKYFIFKNKKLSNISETDLSGKDTITYYENNNHNIVGNGVYDDDDDGKRYVMFSEDWAETAINSNNASVRDSDNVISPNTTESVLRLIVDGTLAVTATQSD